MGLPGFGAKQFVEVALRVDEALDMKDKEYEDYLKTCDFEALKLKPGMTPVLFKLRRILPYHLHLQVENMKMDLVKKKEGDKITNEMVPKMAFICEEVRFSIVDIINPPNAAEDQKIEFKRDSDGLCAPEIMSELMSMNVHMDLYQARQNMVKKAEAPSKKK
jgi:hypothetical protein